jgi:hypothetical protein
MFIFEFYQLYKITITIDQMGLLWRLLASEAPCRVNYELFFKWVNDQVNSMGTKKYSILTDNILDTFYCDYLMPSSNKYENLEVEGFNLIKTLFKIINERDHKIQILNSAQAKKEHGTISSA